MRVIIVVASCGQADPVDARGLRTRENATSAAHGKRRTNADKRRSVMRLLEDAEWGQWSDREIARRCGVSYMTVSRMRPSLSQSDSEEGKTYGELCGEAQTRAYTTKHGTTATARPA